MKCQFCDNPATVHLTRIVNKKKLELHLCEACNQQHELVSESAAPQINLQALLGLLAGPLGALAAGAKAADPAALTCPECGVKYAEFRAEGRLGCPHDYDAFRESLEPLLERIHRSLRHAGKAPAAVRLRAAAAELDTLKRELRDAVAAERYEDAARLRDRIRQKEAPG